MRPGIILTLLMSLQVASGAVAARTDEALTRAKLAELRARIGEASVGMRSDEDLRNRELMALKAIDETRALIAAEAAARDLEASEVAALRAHIDEKRKSLAARIDVQRQRLTGLVRQAHAGGRGEPVRALLDREGSDRSLRQLGYLRVLKREREQRVRRLLADAHRLEQLAEASRAADKAHALATRIDALHVAKLTTQRQRHDASLAALKTRIGARRDVLGQLARDERALMEMLERLTDILADVRADLADQSRTPMRSRGKLPWPVAGSVTQRFGATLAPGRTSDGIVIAAPRGTPVRAIGHGRIAFADWLKGFGMLLIIDHGDGVMSLYAHNESLGRDVGDWVEAGDAVATVGNSGGTSEPGLYFEVRVQSRPQDPQGWLARR